MVPASQTGTATSQPLHGLARVRERELTALLERGGDREADRRD
jgi:hypothetical protein